VPPSRPRPTICFDEWNVWDLNRAVGSEGAEERYTLSDALAVGVWLNVFVRQARWLGMCNLAQSVNVISPLITHAGGLVRQATWWPLWLFARHVRGSTVACHVRCGAYGGETRPEWLQGVLAGQEGSGDGGAPWLDVSGSVDEDEGRATLVVVNIHPERDFAAEVRGVRPGGSGGGFEGYRVDGAALDSVNVVGQEEQVKLSKFDWAADEPRFTFPKHSLTMLRWNIR
jgi:alpha-N-arabinofuranosidase